jgi:hypothetical protein
MSLRVGILLLLAITGWLGYSISVTFSNWPWTQRREHSLGSYLNFDIKSTKKEAFLQLIEGQQSGIIDTLNLKFTEAPTYYRYEGKRMELSDYEYVSLSDEWHITLAKCNCWAELHFASGILDHIVEYRYFGPTE